NLLDLVPDPGAVEEVICWFQRGSGQDAAERHFLARHHRVGKVLKHDRPESIAEGRSVVARQAVAEKAIAALLCWCRRPGFLRPGQEGERDAGVQVQDVVAERPLEAGAAVSPVPGGVNEGALP